MISSQIAIMIYKFKEENTFGENGNLCFIIQFSVKLEKADSEIAK